MDTTDCAVNLLSPNKDISQDPRVLPSDSDMTLGIFRQLSASDSQFSRKAFIPLATRKALKRAILKNGVCNIVQSRTSTDKLRYLQDIFTTLVDSQWRTTLTVFMIVFFGSWFGFALIWWLISLTHGDLLEEHLPINQKANGWIPCITGIDTFTSSFLFSVETQHTTGYGVKVITDECPEAIFVMCIQSIIGLIIQAFMVGIVFAKMTRAKLRAQTLQFSKTAVICQRDGKFCLMFRVGDLRKSHIIGANIRAHLIHTRKTAEGEVLPHFQTELAVSADACEGSLFLVWPVTIVHRIDENSPFFYLSAASLQQERFEILVILEGTIESTSQATQARSSYISSEILWGHRFEPILSYSHEKQTYEVNNAKFDNTMAVDTPLNSPAELAGIFLRQVISLDTPDANTTRSTSPR